MQFRSLVLLVAPLCSAFQMPGAIVSSQYSHMRSPMSMKVFDWKTRDSVEPGLDDVSLDNLQSSPGSRQDRKRKGRGIAAGQGATCGFGMRGQKSRSGRPTRPGFEGGQMPLYRRVPKWVGRPMGPGHSKTLYALIKFDHLNKCDENAEVSYETLLDSGVMTKQKSKLKLKKVVGGGELSVKGLTVKAHAFTESAAQAIEAAGGTCVLLSPTTNQVLSLDEADEEEAVAAE